MRRNDHLLRNLVCGSLVAVIVALAGSVAQGQGGITVTFPGRVVAAPDYATDVLGDAWDMCNAADVSLFPQEIVGFSSSGFSSAPCKWNGTINAADASVVFLHRGLYTIINPGQNGRNFPIDTSKYQVLSYKLNSNAAGAGETPELYWFHNSYGDPSAPPFDGYGRRFAPAMTINGTQIVTANLTQAFSDGVPWTSGPVRGLRIDPNQTRTGQTVSFRWVRLTPASGAVQPITWSGGSGNTTITLRDNSDNTDLTIASGALSSPYSWNYGFLPPGNYTLTVTRGTANGSVAFTINHPPTIQVTDPSATTGQDFATSVRANPWDMSDSGDLIFTGFEHTTAVSFSGGQAHATNTTADPNVTLNRTVPIDTTKYRYLTYRFQVDGQFSLDLATGGSVARLLWGPEASLGENNTTTSKDILVWPGMNTYTVDLASLSTAPDGGLVNSGGGLWTASPKLSLRFDPHEFCSPFQAACARTFHIDDVKLTAKPVAAGSYTIRFAGSDANGDATTVSLYRDTDTNAANGKTLIASGIAMSGGGGQFGWNTNGVPQGEYYIYAEANDGIQTMGRYSTVPVQVGATAGGPRPGDFDGDGKTDVTVYRPSTGTWFSLKSSTSSTTWNVYDWGEGVDVPMPGDYDGDRRTDATVYRPSTGTWFVLKSSTNYTTWDVHEWGEPGDKPMAGDYDGDGRTDVTVYRPSAGTWFIKMSSTNYTAYGVYDWGEPGDIPMPGDYDGDGKTDVTVYRPSTGTWFILKSNPNFTTYSVYAWGQPGDIPMAGDYDGDGRTDVTVYRPSTGTWFVLKSSTNYTTWSVYDWGEPGDMPMPGDYDGDGKTDVTVYRPSVGTWFILKSSTAFTTYSVHEWGQPGDIPAVKQ